MACCSQIFQSDDFYKIYLHKRNVREELKLLLSVFGAIDDILLKSAEFHANYVQTKFDQESLVLPFCVGICVDYLEIERQPNHLLLNKLINEPLQFHQLCHETILTEINAILISKDPSISIQPKQLHIKFDIENFPTNAAFKFSLDIQPINIGLTFIHGVVFGIGPVKKDILQSVWYCSNGCASSEITRAVQKVPQCCLCRKELIEYVDKRAMSDYFLVKIFPIEAVRSFRKIGYIYRAYTLRLNDNLVQYLKLGHEYRAIGVFDAFKKEFNVWRINKI